MAPHFLTAADGQRLYCETTSPPDPRGTVFLLHGYSESLEKYREVIRRFSGAGYRVVGFELRGHGRSGRRGRDGSQVHVDRFDDYVEDAELVFRHLAEAHGPAVLYAHSMGALVGTLLALRNPGWFGKIVLDAPFFGFSGPAWKLRLLSWAAPGAVLLGARLGYVPGTGPFDGLLHEESCGTRDREAHRAYVDLQRAEPAFQSGGPSWAWVAAALRALKDLHRTSDLGRLGMPVLLLRAGEETYVDPGAQLRVARRLPRCRVVDLPGARHDLYREPEPTRSAYWAAVDAFLGARP